MQLAAVKMTGLNRQKCYPMVALSEFWRIGNSGEWEILANPVTSRSSLRRNYFAALGKEEVI